MTALAHAIAGHATTRPAAIAIDAGSSGQISYRALADALPGLVKALVAAVGPARHSVAVRLDHGAAGCLVDLALVEAAIPSIPLAPFFTPDQVTATLAASGCGWLIENSVASIRDGDALKLSYELSAREGSIVDLPDGTVKISFTSGSTGQPKGICLSAEHLVGVAGGVVAYVGAHHAGRHLPLLPPGILLENVAGFYATILAGGTYVALPQAEVGLADPFRPDLGRMLGVIAGQRITSLILVPEYLHGLVAAMEQSRVRLPLLTMVAVGGARVPLALIERAAAVGLPVRQGYGLTECGSVVALERGDEPVRGSVGHAIGANAIRLTADGEIIIDGPSYLGTVGAARSPAPLHTGDIGRIDEDGRLWIEGRKSNLIVTSFGRNISPEWVEGELGAEPAIAQVMVRGDGAAALDALIVPASADADVAQAVAKANGWLPVYARVAGWQIVPPFTPANGMLTSNGRLRRAGINAAFPERPYDMPFFNQLVADTRDAQARLLTVPQLQAGLSGRISRSDYIAYLTQAFHHVRHTVPLMQEARARLGDRPYLVAALDDYIVEETGHEFWILDDIAAAGGDREAAAASDPAPATAAMVEHAYDVIRTGNPAAYFGMVYVLEGTSIAMATTGASAVQAALGLPAEAFRYLTSHGALDQDHMRFFEALMNRIEDQDDRAAITTMAREMFGLFGGMFASIELEAVHAAA